MPTAAELGVSWCDHCKQPFQPEDDVESMEGLFFHPDCPHYLDENDGQEEEEDQEEAGGVA